MALGAVFASLILAVVAVWASRRIAERRAKRNLAAQPARSAATALRVDRLDDIDHAVRRGRCRCGGGLNVVSEGSKEIEGEYLRVVHCECALCEEEQDLFFRAPALH